MSKYATVADSRTNVAYWDSALRPGHTTLSSHEQRNGLSSRCASRMKMKKPGLCPRVTRDQ
jgi:hypothetical protein